MIKAELKDMLSARFPGSNADCPPSIVLDALEKLKRATHHREVTRAKHQRWLRSFEREWGDEDAGAILELGLHYLHLQSNGRLLNFYTTEGRDIRRLSCSSIAELVGASGDAAEATYCVYVHAWPVTPDLISLLAETTVGEGSLAARALQAESIEMQDSGEVWWRSLAYVGLTTTSTVTERHQLDGYDKNALMRETWRHGQPKTVVAFESSDAPCAPLVEVMEYLIVELLGTFGAGFNQQPGGPTGSPHLWLSYDESADEVRALGLTSTRQFHKWCKEHAAERDALRIPSKPHVVYKHQGWTEWADFFGRSWLSYDESADEVRALGLTSTRQFHK